MSGGHKPVTKPTPGLWKLRVSIALAFLFGLGVWVGVFAVTRDDPAPHRLLSALATAGLTLAFGGVAGGLLTQAFRAWDERRTSLAAEQAFYRAILDDLKGVHDRVERARLLIEAHKSAKTYGEQMRILPEADIVLHNIRRALRPGFDDLEREIAGPVNACSAFLKSLTDEFRSAYKGISDAQSRDEAINAHQRAKLAKGEIGRADVVVADEAWQLIEKLPALDVLRDEARHDEYYVAFRWQIDLASFYLRNRLDGGNKHGAAAALRTLKKKRKAAEDRIAARETGQDAAGG